MKTFSGIPKFPKERAKLLALVKEDQKDTKKFIKNFTKKDWLKYQKLYNAREKKLEKIIEKIGVPTIEKVGKDGAKAAWLIIQHSSLPFVQKMLRKFKVTYYKRPDSIFYQGIPYMEDRLRVNSFNNSPPRKQLYGTHSYINKQGGSCLFPIWNFKNVNQRRKRFGLPPLREKVNGHWPRDDARSLSL